ncbi:hypothetical protein WMY93_012003 [Mugilogobius chulae]|uniref:RRM domain-containing protein n=1 Tax=Mugilogobius chulae TaxID=88201 RepID=A0AAW0P3Q6_9GOBI
MSNRYRPPPADTDRRPFFRPRAPGAERGGRMFRGPPPGVRPPWAGRPPQHRPSPHRPPPHRLPPPEHDWPPHPEVDWPPPAPSDWDIPPPIAPPSAAAAATEGVLAVLQSCGLDSEDLTALAELPEDLLTLKSLPLLLKHIKGLKKDPGPAGYLPPGPSPAPHYDQSEALYPGPAPRPELDQSLSLYRDPGPSKAAPSGSSFVVEYGHCAAAQDSRKSPERLRRSSPGFTARGSQEFRRSLERTPILGAVKLSSVPTETEARDFHGKRPPAFPYSCSICDITVLSDFVWSQHVSSTLHADSQLILLQKYPTWDCRMASLGKSDSKADAKAAKKKKEAAVPKKAAKVVCVKFPAKSMDESTIRKLTGEFGGIVHVAMFPSLGFVEMDTPEQAQNVIEHFTKTPHKVKDQDVEFTISTTFNFLQSSFVLHFFPVPFDVDGQSDLLTIVKRFGTPRYTLFTRKRFSQMQAFVEMENAADAHKMVEYYAETPLKMNGSSVKVTFSQEFRTLERCAAAIPYKEEQLKKSEEKQDKSRRESQEKSEAKSPARSVSSDGLKKDESKPSSTEEEAKQTEDAHQYDEGGVEDMQIDDDDDDNNSNDTVNKEEEKEEKKEEEKKEEEEAQEEAESSELPPD